MTPRSDTNRPIAIIGMGMRLPGGVSTAEDFWDLLINKKDGRCRVPESRYKVEGFYSDKSHKETVATEYGYFLKDVNLKAYDSSFFSANRSEAQMIDPQQRLLLEVVWECIENAGQVNLQGTDTGVYVGCYGEDWNNLVHQDTQTSGTYRVLNTADFILSNRISHQYDLRGPSITIRTACSAGMTGLHLACQALQNRDCGAAIVAGSSIILGPSMTQDMTAQGVLSPTGTCKTFDAAADGFARAEAVNAILIKPLEDALRDNDPIRAVIRSTAVNSDGRASNIGVPSRERQEAMIRKAYEIAGIEDFSMTPFIECHGTGTPVGDPIEAAAVASIFGERGAYIGSVKPNFGHTEGASGITSVIKAVLALENEIIPPNIHFSTPNPKIPFEKYKLEVPVEPVPWPKDRHARVSVNCFGIGGANAHVVIDSAASFGICQQTTQKAVRGSSPPCGIPGQAASNQPNGNTNDHLANGCSLNCYTINGVDSEVPYDDTCSINSPNTANGYNVNDNSKESSKYTPQLLVISASNEKSLQQRASNMEHYIKSRQVPIDAVAYTLGCRRMHLPHRSFCITNGTDGPFKFSAPRRAYASVPEIVFVFTGQGAQWAGMGKELCHLLPSFLQDIRQMDRTLQRLTEPPQWKIEEMLCQDVGKHNIGKAEFAQPLSTAIQLALCNLLTKCGVRPNAAVGHSSGEIAAAYIARALTMSEAIICSYMRGLVTKHQIREGRMVAVGMGREGISSFLIDGVQIACENSPRSVTLSGDSDAIGKITKTIKDQRTDVLIRQLRVDMAYHSNHMLEIGHVYEAMLFPHLSAKHIILPIYSTVTGHITAPKFKFDSTYWRRNLESPVLFNSAVQALLGDLKDHSIFLEIGPHSALQGPLGQIFQACSSAKKSPIYVPTLLRDENPMSSFLTLLGQLHSYGYSVDFSFISPKNSVLINLPSYPWDHSLEFWKESRISAAWRSREHPHHELLGASYPATSGLELVWRNLLCCLDVPWLRDHMIVNDVIFPCAGYVSIIGEAIRQATGSEAYIIRDLLVKSAMIVCESEPIEVITTMKPSRVSDYTNSSWYDFSISSFNGTSWIQHCIAQGKASEANTAHIPANEAISSPLPRKVPESYLYNRMKQTGLNFGPHFRSLKDISAHTNTCTARATVRNDESKHGAKYSVHPISIDACIQLSAVALSKGIARHLSSLKIPSRIGLIYVNPSGSELAAEATERIETGSIDVMAITTESGVVIKLEDCKFVQLHTGDHSQQETLDAHAVGRSEWHRDIDFCEVRNLLRRGVEIRDVKVSMEKVTALCILRFLDVIEDLHISPPAGHLTKYVSWLVKEKESMLRGDYCIVPEARQWAAADAESRKILLEGCGTELHALGHHAASNILDIDHSIIQPDNIKAIFSGEVHPLQLYLQDSKLVEFYNYYGVLLDSEDFFKLSAHSRPNMKVLEVGAGTAGTTQVVLDYLTSDEGTRMYSQYMFTDISSGFFAKAKERLAKYEGIEYKALDITKDPADQGFNIGEYDLVVASNVLHATPSLHTTLKHVRSLLRPGGRLYLQELITPSYSRIVPFIMGLLSGWWEGENDDRADQAIVSVERWNQELCSARFCGVEAAVVDDDPLYKAIAHITAVVPAPMTCAKGITLLYDKEKHKFACELAAAFEQNGMNVYWSKICDREFIKGQDVISTIDLERAYFHDISEDDFTNFMTYLTQLKGGVLWLTRSAQIHCTNPNYGLVIGFARTIRAEMSLDFWTAELQDLDPITVHAVTSIAQKFHNRPRPATRSVDCEFSVHDGGIYISRYHWSSMAAELAPQLQDSDPKKMAVGQPGMLDSLHWVQQPSPTLHADEVEVDIRCTGLNFRDIMVAMGILQGPKDDTGYEAAGVVTRVGFNISHLQAGDRVMMLYTGLFATKIVMHGELVFRIPEDLSFESAATMGIVYCTVIHAIINKGELQKGQSILIHSACGGVGQAALQICKMLSAEVYATVGSEEKIQYLTQHYNLPRDRIFNSRNASFYDDVMRVTKNRGVDMVLNSLSGDLLHASWRCVAKWGKMMEIGKRDIIERGHLALDMFNGNRTYYGINLDGMFERPKMLQRLMEQTLHYYSERHIKPIQPMHTFPAQSISEAFRYMQRGQHMGKVVITMPEDTTEIPSTRVTQAVALSNSSTYLMVGGLGGLGKAVAAWMVENGVRSFVFLSRSAGESAEDQNFLQELKCQGCSVVTVAGSVVEMSDVTKAIEAAPTPIAGVIQMSMVLRDLPLLNTTHNDWKYVQGPKVTGTWNLHKALLGVNLNFFILFSSLSAVFGQPGQASYSSANAFLGSFAQYRHSLGLPCSVIDIGAMGGIGIISNTLREKQFRNQGMTILQEQDLIEAIQLSIKQSKEEAVYITPGKASSRYTSRGQFAIGMASSRPLADPSSRHPIRNDIRMGLAWQLERKNEQSTCSNSDGISQLLNLVAQDAEILNQESTLELVTSEIGRILCGFMMVQEENLDTSMSLVSMGVDSLVSIEIRNWWRGTLGVDVSVLEITNAGTIERLGKLAVTLLQRKFGVKESHMVGNTLSKSG